MTANNPISHRLASLSRDTNAKCCAKCAFRAGSPERENPWEWMKMAENAAEGRTFYCHESIPGHPGHVPGGSPFRICAGRAALDGKDIMPLCFPAIRSERLHAVEAEGAA